MAKGKLSKQTVETKKCPSNKKSGINLSDGNNLYLLVKPDGLKTWFIRLHRDGKETKRGLGSYPEVSLAEARQKTMDFKKLWSEGKDPRVEKAKSKFQAIQDNSQIFEHIQEQCFNNKIKLMSLSHQKRWRGMYQNYLKRQIGILPLSEITDSMVLEIVETVYVNAPQTANKVKHLVSVVFNYAIEKRLFKGINPCLLLRGNSLIKKPKNKPMIYLEEHRVGEFLHKLDAFQNQITRTYLYTIMMTALRANSLRQAKWSWIGNTGIMTIPSEHMKGREKFRCPIPKQALKRLQDLKKILNPKQSDYIFKGLKEGSPISDNTSRLALQEIMESKYHIHGFRTLFNRVATSSNKFTVEQIESQLTHAFFKTDIRKIYMGDEDYLDERIKITQYFNDWCEKQRDLYKEANGIV